jgi:hypothetical protein
LLGELFKDGLAVMKIGFFTDILLLILNNELFLELITLLEFD